MEVCSKEGSHSIKVIKSRVTLKFIKIASHFRELAQEDVRGAILLNERLTSLVLRANPFIATYLRALKTLKSSIRASLARNVLWLRDN